MLYGLHMALKTLGIGIWGAGVIAEFHALALREIPNVKLIAAYNRTPEKARTFSEKYKISFAATPEELLNNPAIDIICLCTASGNHLEPALACAQAGKHVIVEKPIEVTLARCDQMISACHKAGVTLGGILPRRFGHGAVALKSAITSGRFGQITLASALIPWWRSQEYYDSAAWRGTQKLDGGGALMNQGIHTIDLLVWLLGPVKRVSATMGLVAHKNIEVEDIATGWIEFTNGARATIAGTTTCWSQNGLPAEIRIHGTTGSAILHDDKLVTFEFKESQPGDQSQIGKITQGAGANDPRAIDTAWHKANLEEIIGAIHENKKPSVDGIEGRKAVELILALYQSAQQNGLPINL
jgi:predicted dehydrogenase